MNPLKDKAIVQVGIVNQSLLEVVNGIEQLDANSQDQTTTEQEKKGIAYQLDARIGFHMQAARQAIDTLERLIATKRLH